MNKMMHAISDSDITSMATSSPRSSPKPQQQHVYYVQSPSSRDSHDEDKSSTSASATATRASTTPVGLRSPSDALSLLSIFSRQSRSSSSNSRVSGGHHNGFRRKGRRERERRRLLGRRHVEGLENVVEEEEEVERDIYVNWWRDEDGEELSRSCKVLMGVMLLGLVFCVGCLIVWGASKPFVAQIQFQKMVVKNINIWQGSDSTGVPSKMLTMECTLRMIVHNPATFFGIHVTCSTINLRYFDLNIASGQVDAYYQPRKSWRNITVNIVGKKIPLYGAGTGFALSNATGRIPLILEFEMWSQGNLVGKLVKAKHLRKIRCTVIISSPTNIAKFADDWCE